MIRHALIALYLLLDVFTINALSGKIVVSPELYKGWQFTKSFVFAKERSLYYPVEPDGSFSIPSDGSSVLTLTTFVPGFQKKTESFPSDATDVRLVVQIQIVAMETTTYDAEVPRWLVDLDKNMDESQSRFLEDMREQDEIASLIPFQVSPKAQSPGAILEPPEIRIDIGKLINLVLRLVKKE